MTGLEGSLAVGGLTAFAGAMVGVMTLGGNMPSDTPADEAGPQPLDRRLTVGAYLLAAHAVAAAGLWQVPTIGACLAASLGAGWIGAGAAGLVGLMSRHDHLRRRVLTVVFRLALGFGLFAPLWAYVRLMQMHALSLG